MAARLSSGPVRSSKALMRWRTADGVTCSRSAAASKVRSPITAADAASSGGSRLVDRHLRRLGPAGRIDGLADDARRTRQRLRQVAHRGLEMIAVEVCCAGVGVAE